MDGDSTINFWWCWLFDGRGPPSAGFCAIQSEVRSTGRYIALSPGYILYFLYTGTDGRTDGTDGTGLHGRGGRDGRTGRMDGLDFLDYLDNPWSVSI